MPIPARLAWPEFLDGLRSPSPAERWSALSGHPLVVVDLTPDGDDDRVTELADAVATLPCAVIGIVPPRTGAMVGGEIVDVLLTDGPEPGRGVVPCPEGLEPTLELLAERAERWPRATAAMAVLLRGTLQRSLLDGLVAESTVYSMLQGGPEFGAWRATRRHGTHGADATDPLQIEREGQTLRITFDRPARHNAYGTAMRDHLAAALELAAVDDEITRIELRGAGRSFCSGGDLDEFGTLPDPATAHLVRLTRSPARLLVGLAPRVETHLHGACIGAGIELPAFGARVVAAPDTRIRLPELEFGLVPGAGGTVSLPRRIGRHRTAYLALSGAVLDAPTAHTWGLVDELTG